MSNDNLYTNNYEKFYHGNLFFSIESIMKLGIKKRNPLKGNIPINVKKNNFDIWADAIFISPSIFYAAEFSDIIISEHK